MKRANYLFLFLILILSGCPLEQKVLLVNNSAKDAVIVLNNQKDILWPVRNTVIITDSGRISWSDLEWVGDSNINLRPLLEVECHGDRKTYDLSTLPYGEKQDAHLGKVMLSVELNRACQLAVLQ